MNGDSFDSWKKEGINIPPHGHAAGITYILIKINQICV